MINLQLFCRRKFDWKKLSSNQVGSVLSKWQSVDISCQLFIDNMDLLSQIDSHAEIIITGIESEEVEEINDAYKDILEEMGKNITFKHGQIIR